MLPPSRLHICANIYPLEGPVTHFWGRCGESSFLVRKMCVLYFIIIPAKCFISPLPHNVFQKVRMPRKRLLQIKCLYFNQTVKNGSN